jgi:nucleoside-diphosphate-sugar epimerase
MAKKDGRVVSNFINQALSNENITIYGDGNQTRSFCYVDDLIDGFIKLFFSENIHEPINLGNPQPITMQQLASEIIQMTGSISKISYEELPSDDPKDREPDISKAAELLNWIPKTDRSVGLKRTIEYFRSIS